MLLAVAVLLLQNPAIPQPSFDLLARVEDISVNESAEAPLPAELRLPLTPDRSESLEDALALGSVNLPAASEMAQTTLPSAITLPKPNLPATISVADMREETRGRQRAWFTIAIAAHSTALLDAWSTRHAITAHGAQELNPLLKPFAGNASLYLAIQAGPALMDFVGKKMMYSRHSWIRHSWWVPQALSVAGSLFCAGHNLSMH